MNEVIWHKKIDRDFWCEVKYLDNIIDILNTNLDEYSIIVTPISTKSLPETKYKKIVIVTGDEVGRLGLNPYVGENVKYVFRIYNRINRYDNDYIFPISCGYNCTMHSDRTKKMKKMYPGKPLSERKFDIFYSGQIIPPITGYHTSRSLMNESLFKLSKSFKIYNNNYIGFRTGIDIDEYYKTLGETKISLCPEGTSVDTFRYNESLGSGCVVITTKKDDLWYYKDSPAIFLDSWSQLNDDLISGILNNDIDDLYEKNLKHYNDVLSEQAQADYILKKINKIDDL